jgi:hypothetical protein
MRRAVSENLNRSTRCAPLGNAEACEDVICAAVKYLSICQSEKDIESDALIREIVCRSFLQADAEKPLSTSCSPGGNLDAVYNRLVDRNDAAISEVEQGTYYS